eukprot:scaffold19921_cov39-Cyclotella_meneghiniana.AAC.1
MFQLLIAPLSHQGLCTAWPSDTYKIRKPSNRPAILIDVAELEKETLIGSNPNLQVSRGELLLYKMCLRHTETKDINESSVQLPILKQNFSLSD